MTKPEKKRFIVDICDGMKAYMLERIDQVPEDWDGHELRHWFADRASSLYAYSNLTKGRKREYNNTLLVRNL